MATLRDFLTKEASRKKTQADLTMQAMSVVVPPGWAPPEGWKSATNPNGWIKPGAQAKIKELYLWHKWKEQGERPEDMEPLLKSLRPLVYRYGVQGWVNKVPISRGVLEAEANRLAISALETYDPTKAQMNTYLQPNLRGMDRFVKGRQNFARVTADRLGYVGQLNRAVDRLKERLGREPTVTELADEMKVPVSTVEKLLSELKKDNIASVSEEDPFLEETPKARSILRLIRYELTPTEELVFDYLTGSGGKPLTSSTGDIARKLGWSDSKVSTTKKSIQNKIKQYI